MGPCAPRSSPRAKFILKVSWDRQSFVADGEGKIAAQKEVALAQDALFCGKMSACSMHLGKAMHTGMAK